MKKALIAMLLMAIFLIGGGGLVSMLFTHALGGGVEQSYIYPIYGAIIVLTGVIVGAAQVIVNEIRNQKNTMVVNRFAVPLARLNSALT